MMERHLAGKRIAILSADGFEQVELTIPRTALRLAGADVDIVSLHEGKIRGMNLHMPGRRIRVDRTLTDANPSNYDALYVPGGFINPDLLRQSVRARSFVRDFELSDKPIASICHGPWVLASAGILNHKHVTSWPGIRDDLVHAGAVWHDRAVVRDGALITSRGPQDLAAFVPEMIRLFAGQPSELRAGDGASDPPRTAPPAWAIAPMAAITVPRLLLGAAAVSGLAVAAVRRFA